MISTLLLLGATGDLARRHLFPALGALAAAGRLPDDFAVIGGAHDNLDAGEVRQLAGDALPAGMLSYRPVDLARPADLAAALEGRDGPVAAYLALPPAVFALAIESLAAVGLARGSRIAVEKPFGDDAASARALNEALAQTGADVYRVDHALGMETTRNLVALRVGNPVLEAIWNASVVERVEIRWEETLGLEGRAGYYDDAGALKDVVQNHVLQVLAVVAMDEPDGSADLPRRKRDAFDAVRATQNSRRARYTAGTLADGRAAPAYADEAGVDRGRETETYAEVVVEVDTPRWTGTSFVLRAGKALAARRKLVALHLRGGGLLEIGIDGPYDVTLHLAGSADRAVVLTGPAPGDGLPPYAHVLGDILRGTSEMAVGAEEAEQAWRIVAPVLDAWAQGQVPLEEYATGSSGPS